MSAPLHIILSCEHAGNTVPSRYQFLFADHADVLSTHRAYDLGVAPVAAAVQKRLACPLCRYDLIRLLVDVNRTKKRSLFSEFSRPLPQAEKQYLLDHYYLPYRNQLCRTIREKAAHGRVLHLSLHSFTPELRGRIRNAQIGILYDPARTQEANFSKQLQGLLRKQTSLRIRRNYPYRGTSDGMTSWLRTQFPQTHYLGIEIEFNQAFLAASKGSNIARHLTEAIHALTAQQQ